MIPSIWRNWTHCLVITGACLLSVGCGGGDIPDPEADTALPTSDAAPPEMPAPPVAAAEPKAEEQPAAAAPAPEAAAAPAAPRTAPNATPSPETPIPPQVAAAQPQPAPTPEQQLAAPDAAAQPQPAPDSQPKPDAGATTSEMLALSSGSSPTPPPTPAAGSNAASPGTPGAPGAPATPPAQPSFRGKDRDEQFTPPTKPNEGAAPRGGMIARRGGRDEFDDFGGGKDRDGGSRGPRSNEPVNFNNPRSSVQAFLDALEDKDVDRLSEATALRAPQEASSKNQELFKSILEGSISEAQLNDLAEQLSDYKISGEAARTSTGKVGILVTKPTDTGRHQRTIQVRKEKAGWKVLDISSIIDFKTFRRPTNRARTGRP